MDPERWKQVDNLLQAALERPPEEREAFLKQACAGDEQLEREIRSLLASRQKAGSFLESPAMEVAARAEALRGAGQQTDPLIGQTVSHYRIIGKLGMGGMGVVYKATDEKLHRIVALKCLRAEESTGSERNRFLQEARAASALDHPNIGVVYGIEELDDHRLFIIMAYYEGETLAERLKRAPLDPVAGVGIVRQTAEGLAEAHARNIVHRDIKPSNIMITRQGLVKLLDFGLAKQLSGDETLTQTGTTMGTAAYMSPEQAMGRRTDHRTDIWALGVVLYEILSGRQPFRRDSVPSTLLAVTQEAPPPLVGVRAELQAAVFKCLSKDLDRRYQSATDLIRDLDRASDRVPAVGGESTITMPIEIRPDSAPPATAQEGIAKRWKTLVPTAAVVLGLLAGGYLYFGRPLYGKPKLTDKDTIVLADFVNTTGDSVFDETLRRGLAIQLEQSPFLSLVPDESIEKTLALMGQNADARLTPQLAREICERTGSAAVLEGSIASLGSKYVLGLRAKNCRSGVVLDDEQVQAGRKEDVLDVLSQIAIKFRTKVGESLATIKEHNTPLEDATTSSLEALEAYSAGWKHLTSDHDLAAVVPLFKRAIQIDPKFAMAHAALGFTYGFLSQPVLSAESNQQAYELRDRASDREKFFIAATYETQVTGDLRKAQQTCELWVQAYPREKLAHGILGSFVYPTFGKYEKGIEVARQMLEANPDFPIAYLQLAFNDQFAGHLAEAEKTLQLASARKLEIPELAVQRYDIAFLKGDQAGMDREATLAKSAADDLVYDREGFVLAYSGHLKEARSMAQRAENLNQEPDQRGKKALFEIGPAVWDAFFGNVSAARTEARAAVELAMDRDIEYGAAFALALSGESAQSRILAKDLETRFPEDTGVREFYLPAIRALLELGGGEPSKAIDLLEISRPVDQGLPPSIAPAFIGPFYTVYVRGLAYLKAHQGAEAAAEFQRLLDGRTIVVSDPVGALAHLQLGRALALSGDNAKAKTAYQDFLTLWKEADSDIPVLKQAKAEFANLR